MSSPTRCYFYQRRWLNVQRGRAYTIADVEHDWKDHISVYLEIGDCADTITLDFCFDASNSKEFNKQLKKLDKFIETCQNMREAMTEARKNHKDE